MIMNKNFRNDKLLLVVALSATFSAHAGQAPDAGRTIQEMTPPLVTPEPAKEFDLEMPSNGKISPGGDKVTLQSVSIEGNTLFSNEVLLSIIGDFVGQSYDMSELAALAGRVTLFYRENGYPFSRASLPAQKVENGDLKILVVEGRYGDVTASGEGNLGVSAQAFLEPLTNGKIIKDKELERALLLIEDQPGIAIKPIIRPGQTFATGDLGVAVNRVSRFGGEFALDNHGNRYTGEERARLSLRADSPFTFGDQVLFNVIASNEDLWLGSVGYSLPIGARGLRGQVNYSHTDYQLGKEFNNLNATGYAKVASGGLSYPLIRSKLANLTLGVSFQHKRLEDKTGIFDLTNNKKSNVVPVVLQFDRRDNFYGGGITYGAFTWSHGQLKLDDELKSQDVANTDGSFNKLNIDIARIQLLPNNFSLYGKLQGQWTNDNLDSSEDFGLGGPTGVRAYPTGEGFGDEGLLGQIELRYRFQNVSPYIFADSGRVRINNDRFAPGNNHRSVSGAGIGVRAEYKNWNLDSAVAWRIHGGEPQSVNQDPQPRFWITGGYKF